MIARFGSVPVLGQLDITAEATAYGGVLALRALVVIGCFALHSAAVDPDDLLRAFRRVSFRSALTAALATRMVPVLARDARRLHDAQRCLAGAPAPRRAIVRAVASGALDRAVDVAATLEVRGYGAARRAPRGGARPWSRHDLAFAASAGALALLGVGALGAATARRSRPTRRSARPWAAGSSRSARRWRCARCCRSPTGGGSGDERGAAARAASPTAIPGAAAPALRDVDLVVEPGEFVVLAGGSGSGKSTLLRAASGLVPHFHGGEFAGWLVAGGLDTRTHEPAAARRGRRLAVPGPRDAGRDGHRARRAGVPAGEPRARRRRGRARGGGGGARARHRAAAGPLHPRAVGRRAAAGGARRRAGRPAARRAARRADVAARPGRGRRAARRAAPHQRGVGDGGRSSPSTGWSAA